MAEGASTRAPSGRFAATEARPVCMSCAKIAPPFAWTALVTAFQPSTCAAEKRPGMRA